MNVTVNTLYCLLFVGLSLFTSACSQQGPSQLFPSTATSSSSADSGPPPSSGEKPDDGPVPSERPSDHLSVDAGPNQVADPNVLVTLRGAAETLSSTPLIYVEWTQLAGPSASIVSPYQLVTPVLLPDVSENAVLVFKLTGVNGSDLAHSATTAVIVEPAPERGLALPNVISDENAGAMVFSLRLNAPATSEVALEYTTADRTALAGQDYVAASGRLVFQVGEVEKTVSIELIDDAEQEENKFFELGVAGIPAGLLPNSTSRVIAKGIINDDDARIRFPTIPPLDEGPAAVSQVELAGNAGNVRGFLTWDSGATALNLRVSDPCGSVLYVESPAVDCLSGEGALQNSESWQNAYWPSYSPPGEYGFSVEHVSGWPTDYALTVFYGDQSRHFTGTLGNGDIVDVFSFVFDGADAPSSSSSVASSIGSASSIASSVASSSSVSSVASSVPVDSSASSSLSSSVATSGATSSVSSSAASSDSSSSTDSAWEPYLVEETEVNDNEVLANHLVLRDSNSDEGIATIGVVGQIGGAGEDSPESEVFNETFEAANLEQSDIMLLPGQFNAGSINDFILVEDDYGLALEVQPGPDQSHITLAQGLSETGALQSLAFKFKLEELGTDDNGAIILTNENRESIFSFGVARDSNVDQAQRFTIQGADLGGEDFLHLGGETVEVGSWYQFNASFNSVTASLDVNIVHLESGAVFGEQSIPLVDRSDIQYLAFINDNFNGAGRARFDDVELTTVAANGFTSNPASDDVFVFKGVEGSTYSLHYHRLNGSPYADVTVLDSEGNEISTMYGYDSLVTNIAIPQTGEYTIRVSTRNANIYSGNYQLVLVTKAHGNLENENNNSRSQSASDYLALQRGESGVHSDTWAGTVHANDVDHFYTYLLAGDRVTYTVNALASGNLQPKASLYLGETVVASQVNEAGAEQISLSHTVEQDGLYFLQVDGAEGKGDFGFYTLDVTVEPVDSVARDFEPNDTVEQAERLELIPGEDNEGIAVGRAVGDMGNWSNASADQYVFSAQEGSTYSLHYHRLNGSPYADVTVLDSEGNEVSTMYGYDSLVTNIAIPQTGEYTIRVSTRNANIYSGNYQLVLVTKAHGNLENENNNSRSQSASDYLALQRGESGVHSDTWAGTVHANDVDHFYTYLLAGDRVTYTVNALASGNLKPKASLYLGETVVASQVNEAGAEQISLSHTVEQDGLYFLQVDGAEGKGDFGFYTLDVTVEPVDSVARDFEPNDTVEQAERLELIPGEDNEGIAVGRAVGDMGNWSNASADQYVFSAQEGSTYSLHYHRLNGSPYADVTVLDSEGNEISTMYGYDSLVTNIAIPQTGEYTIRVSTRNANIYSGNYQLVLVTKSPAGIDGINTLSSDELDAVLDRFR